MKKKLKNDSPSQAAACSPSYYTFRNREGQTFQLRGEVTLEDLLRMGCGDIRLVKPETPLKPHHWRCDHYIPPPPVDPRFARFGEALWQYIIKRGGDFCRDEISEDILPLAEAAGLCCRVKYDPEIHGDMIDAEPGCEIWWWGNF